MTIVERAYPGFQWAEPLEDMELQVKWVGADLEIAGRFPLYFEEGSPCDLINQYEKFPKKLAMGWQRTVAQSPEMRFANAKTDEELVRFIRDSGPVVAKCVKDTRLIPDDEMGEPDFPGRLIAVQNMQELRKEAAAYRAALSLVMELNQPRYDCAFAQEQIKTISKNIKAWPRQWTREKSLSRVEPKWKISAQSIKRIEALSSARRIRINLMVAS